MELVMIGIKLEIGQCQ